MSNQKREKVIHVDNLVIHAKNVEVIQERPHHTQPERRNPWDFFFRGQPRTQENLEGTAENISQEQNE
ncbi:hypothetical protein MXL46_05820 [Heyndrickxia sporothermodurans]|uniref:Uncharacterized protein n=1 Tax=Heyndrickxia sporothermodurans TaxID=46224 RepID=A0A150LCM5_9BACI|nr:hypothetical protein [Heyndrickxia sporothermodurans]KYD09990.1 hypothetical protein B4102_2403 [Heyndrickxia sporothermodurans]MBL5766989.1 hypothetical protein [Heyndrickxia sporothermodurans]MBL5770457.1 hypothetical protein [Heyndrickxia sporothermodurans]MBL5774146.1 hypothetical protein [Heyndrickxia sporothermodurans]MBL5778310.1 hypothetical protein [Heyndrickxia sporothermodurans]